jgi:hypothetical protein
VARDLVEPSTIPLKSAGNSGLISATHSEPAARSPHQPPHLRAMRAGIVSEQSDSPILTH